MNNQGNIWYFEDIDLYNILCPHKVPSMQEKHSFHKFKKDAFIYFEDEQSDHIYLIAEGRVKIGSYTEDGREVTKAILSAGEIFGELALIGQDKRTDFAQAMDENTTICPMNIDDMKESRTRIVEFLRDWATEKGKKVGFETMMKNYLTHKDIASLTGTSRQTVTTILNELKEKNIINFDRRRILVRDMEKLV